MRRVPESGRPARGARLVLAVATVAVAGCGVRAVEVGGLAGREARLPAMVLATGAEGCDCVSAVLAPPGAPSVGRAVEEALAQVEEAVVLTDATIETSALLTGIYNRRCVRVRGSAARLARQIVLPAPAGHHGHH